MDGLAGIGADFFLFVVVYIGVSDDNEEEARADDREPVHLVPPTVESLRLRELARQRRDRFRSLLHYVGTERVEASGQRVRVADGGAEPALHPIEPHPGEDEGVVALERSQPGDPEVLLRAKLIESPFDAA